MEQSILNFRAIHPDWMPGDIDDDDSSAFVNRVNDPLRSANAFRSGATNVTRPSQPYLGFAASSQVSHGGRGEQSRVEHSRADLLHHSPSDRHSRRMQSAFSQSHRARIPMVNSELLQEMDEREMDDGTSEPDRFNSELGDSFMTPSQAVEESHEEPDEESGGVLGLLNHLYQETGTGKGIGGM